MMNTDRPDYFGAAPSAEDMVLRRIKGNYRRSMVFKSCMSDGLASIPELWIAHDIAEQLKTVMTASGGPQARGGEDLPNLNDGEVEIARLTLVDSVHGEVTSLRAKRTPDGRQILLTMVDEYETEFTLPRSEFPVPLTAKEVLFLFRDANPTPLATSCQIRFASHFYPNLDGLASELGISPVQSQD
jgi:hypothetical protein